MEDTLNDLKEKFRSDLDYWSPEFERHEDDTDFSLGNQWPADVQQARLEEKRPCLTENRIDVSCIQTVNDIRQTRPAIQVSPCDDKADIETARVLKGIVRNIEQQSNANNAYDNAAECAVRGGLGWIRIGTRYEAPDSFDQEAYIDAVENPYSCLIDAGARKLDGSDAERGWAFTDIPREQFKAQYPNADECSFDDDVATKDEWADRETVRIAECFIKEKTEITLVRTPRGTMTKEEAEKLQIAWDKERKSAKETIKWYKFTGKEILEETVWPGKYIPIVPVYGKVVWHERRRKSYSLTYQGRDSQIRYNYHLTAETEWTALQPKAPWVMAEGQADGYEELWETSNVKNHPVLYYRQKDSEGNPVSSPPQRQGAPSGSAALMQQTMIAADGIKATLGIFDASLGNRGNETSGRAILARQAEGDNATFHFVDNLATSIRHVGRILVDLIPKLYSGKTIARILGDDGEARMAPLGVPVRVQGKEYVADPSSPYVIALDAGKYDVAVSLGPSYATKRQEMVTNMIEIFKMHPEALGYGGDIFFRNTDWDGAQELAERAAKMLPPQLKDDAPEQQALMQAEQQIRAMGEQLMQLDAKLKEKQDNQAVSNELEAKKINLQHQIDTRKLELEREKLVLQTLQSQDQLTPEQVQIMTSAIFKINDDLADTREAIDILLTGLESAAAPVTPEVTAIPQ